MLNFAAKNKFVLKTTNDSDTNKTIRQIILEKNSKVIRLSDRAYAYKD